MAETKETKDASEKTDSKKTLHPILINHAALSDDDDFFKGHMRPRANTDPVSPRPRLHVHFDLPDIIVDDCSDNDEENLDKSRPDEINKELANTDEGAFFVFKSPPRQRSNTCPINMFSKKKSAKNRPPTPPPSGEASFPRYPSWEKVSFTPHTLQRVSEDTQADSSKQSDKKKAIKSHSSSHTDSKSKPIKIPARKKMAAEYHGSPSRSCSPPKHSPATTKLHNGHVPSKTRHVIET